MLTEAAPGLTAKQDPGCVAITGARRIASVGVLPGCRDERKLNKPGDDFF
jgi:hypothetical protein